MLVQSWRYNDWPAGHYSKATFPLQDVSGRTRLTLAQTDVPEESYDDIAKGWREYYWPPLKKMLE